MDSPRSTCSRTRRSVSKGVASFGRRDETTAVLVFARRGKSHSWLTPTISSSSPRANKISVADGSKETMRIQRTLAHCAVGGNSHQKAYSRPVSDFRINRELRQFH